MGLLLATLLTPVTVTVYIVPSSRGLLSLNVALSLEALLKLTLPLTEVGGLPFLTTEIFEPEIVCMGSLKLIIISVVLKAVLLSFDGKVETINGGNTSRTLKF